MTRDTLAQLRDLGNSRRDRWHTPDTEPWTGADWSNAMCGEAGEAANVVKKLRRLETGTANLPPSATAEASVAVAEAARGELVLALSHELADTIAYADLLAQHYNIDLAAAVARKFNIVSEREGFPERMDIPSDHDEDDADGYAVEILVNPGSSSERWQVDRDLWDPFDSPESASNYRDELIEDGYHAEHVRVVALVPWEA